jgi:hypothetical protein
MAALNVNEFWPYDDNDDYDYDYFSEYNKRIDYIKKHHYNLD